ncbi:MAG: protein translocase subunit SecD [Nitrospinaceae bacterium]|nr:protein translocase subunit SecD [Nitrospinaceae bacterium]MDP6657918.1 protein translocase subunit SecD [Nitrospinaceae bacterium]MDP6711176.1 protein translocase subunit SecD [Nitrospinaceae bacterium]MDP7057179.1 protein translocase subunit SecD [Nitrospinaceae bacterium]HAK37358.1 protein translocase subunit SecD [Nitrospina sp.]|tara:strand:+ start:1644 stop:3200 length:1557 start_codon:yes stop_codon:yes gene_type:complete
MFTDLKWKIPLILFVVLGSAFLAYPLQDKIALGLDLQGGMHLVLEVQTEKAVEASLERIASDIKREIENEDYEVDRVSTDLVNKTVTVLMVDAMDLEPVEEIMKNYTAYMKNEGKVREGRGYKFSLSKEEEKRIQQNAVSQGLETIRNRVDQFGVAEPTIQAQGERRILIQLPGIKDAERAIKLIGKTARLDFKMVDESISAETALNGSIPDGDQILYKREENLETGEVTKTPFLVKKRTVLTGETLSGADVRYDTEFNEPYVAITFNSIGAMIFQEVTRENVKKRLAIVLDDHVYSAPVIQEEIAGGRAQITGQFTTEEARDLAIVLRAGALPAPVVILENRTVGPSLGKDSIEQGVQSILLGFVLVMVFIVIYYKFSGIVAVMALLLNLVLMLGALAYFGAALTLPGIAGVLLTVGMAIDANVLIFERIREETRVGKTVRAAIDAGYAKAFSTIVDANLTTFIAAVVLFQFGTGPVKGFAITLCIGIAASMFTAVFVSRAVFDIVMSRKKITSLSI